LRLTVRQEPNPPSPTESHKSHRSHESHPIARAADKLLSLTRRHQPPSMPRKPAFKWREFLKSEGSRRATSFQAAFSGLRRLITSERHFQLHLSAATCAIILAAFLDFSRLEWAILLVTIGLVLVAEGLNSAIERAIDTTTPGFHPLAKAAKDIAAAAVLIAAIISVVVGLLLYGPKLWALLTTRH
jgi:undecaprenol kinase